MSTGTFKCSGCQRFLFDVGMYRAQCDECLQGRRAPDLQSMSSCMGEKRTPKEQAAELSRQLLVKSDGTTETVDPEQLRLEKAFAKDEGDEGHELYFGEDLRGDGKKRPDRSAAKTVDFGPPEEFRYSTNVGPFHNLNVPAHKGFESMGHMSEELENDRLVLAGRATSARPAVERQLNEMLDSYRARFVDRTALAPEEYRSAVLSELVELEDADSPDRVRAEFGDVLANVLYMGFALGIDDPMQQAWNSKEKVRKRLAYIKEHITRNHGEPGYREEFDQLWEAAKSAVG